MEKISFVYVVATSYSGSTLLSILMNAHPEVVSVGELANSIGIILNRRKTSLYHCSCGEEITECSYWKEIRALCYENGVELDLHDFRTKPDMGFGPNLNRLFFGIPDRFAAVQTLRNNLLWMAPFFRERLRNSISRNLVIARSVLKASGKKIFLDASKNATTAFYYSKSEEIDFKMIHLVRDPRGLLHSAMKRHKECDLNHIMKYWRRIHGSAMRLKNSLDEKSYMLVNYERLCSNTDDALQDICRFVGVEPADLVNPAGQSGYHIIGNSMRRKKFTGVKYDECWQQNLTTPQIDTCMEMAGSLGVLLGYGTTSLPGSLPPEYAA